MPKMRGTGKDPLGRYSENLIFDLEDNDPEMVQDFVDRGWAEVLPPEEHPGRTVTQIANSVVRGDDLSDPTEREIADKIGDNAHAIVHLEDPDATQSDYEEEAKKGPGGRQKEVARQIPANYHGGVPEYERGSGGGARKASAAPAAAAPAAPAAAAQTGSGEKQSGSAEKQPGGAAK